MFSTTDISTSNLHETFDGWRMGKYAHDNLLQLNLLSEHPSIDVRDYLLHSIVQNLFNLRLRQLRQAQGILHNPHVDYVNQDLVLEVIAMDAVQPMGRLFSWSATYFSKAIPISIEQEIMADAVRMNPDVFEAFVTLGVRYLREDLLLLERLSHF